MMSSYFDIPHPTFTGYGLGVRRNSYAGRTMWGHTGGMRGYGSHMFYDPTSKISMAVLNNQSRTSDGPTLRHELFEELMDNHLKKGGLIIAATHLPLGNDQKWQSLDLMRFAASGAAS